MESFLIEEFNLKEKLGDVGREMYFDLVTQLKARILPCGRIVVARTNNEMRILETIKSVADTRGTPVLEILDRRGLEEKEPGVDPKFIGGLYDPTEVSIFPVEWAIAFADNAKNNGVRLLLSTEVKGIDHQNDRYVLTTSTGKIETLFIINTAGLFADEVAAMVGRTNFSFNIFKCQMMIIESEYDLRHVLCEIAKPQQRRLLIPTLKGKICVSHSMDAQTSKYDLSTTKNGLSLISGYPAYFAPSLAKHEVLSAYVGLIHYNNRSRDYILEWQQPRFLNVLVTAPGNGPAPALAKEIVRMLSLQGLKLTLKREFHRVLPQSPRLAELSNEKRNEKIQENPKYGHLICRCEHVSEQEVLDAVKNGARTLDEVKWRTGAGMGRCQGGYCTPQVLKIMAEELGVSPLNITKRGGKSVILTHRTKDLRRV